MKRLFPLLLCLFFTIVTFSSCEEKPCEHVYLEGSCQKCNTVCTHSYENGSCSICSTNCVHSYENGSCSICSINCVHSYENGICKVCSSECPHEVYDSGVCTICEYVCEPHTYEEGICSKCGTIKLSKDALAKKTFKFSHFEISWAEETPDTKKEIYRKQFGVDNDTELFVELNKEIRQTVFVMIDEYDFTDNDYVIYSTALGKEFKKYHINSAKNIIYIDKEKFYFAGDSIYCLYEDLTNYNGIEIRAVFS